MRITGEVVEGLLRCLVLQERRLQLRRQKLPHFVEVWRRQAHVGDAASIDVFLERLQFRTV